MIFILEGCDKTGKSTLAKALAEKHGFKIIHLDPPKSQEEIDATYDMYMQLYKDSNNVIFDRSFYSNLVYGPIYRKGPEVTDYQRKSLELLLLSKGVVIIHCTDTLQKVWERCIMDGDEYATSRELTRSILEGYDRVMAEVISTIPVVRYTIGDGSSVLEI